MSHTITSFEEFYFRSSGSFHKLSIYDYQIIFTHIHKTIFHATPGGLKRFALQTYSYAGIDIFVPKFNKNFNLVKTSYFWPVGYQIFNYERNPLFTS